MSPDAPRFLLVDGHSIIHAWPDLLNYHRQAARRHLAREQLMHHLRNYQDMSGERVIVVFDGNQSKTTEEREPDGLHIFYAAAGVTADTIIERLVAQYAKAYSLCAATADGMIRETVDAFGGRWISPESLRSLVDGAEGNMRERINKR